MNFVRSFALIIVLVNLSCVKAPRWTSNQWQGKGSKPLPSTFFKQITNTTLKNHTIEIKQQTVGGVPVDGSFAKTVVATTARASKSEARSTWISSRYIEANDLPSPTKVRQTLPKRRSALAKLNKNLPKDLCKSEIPMANTQPLIKWVKRKWRTVFIAQCEDRRGQVHQIVLSEQGNILELTLEGSSFVDSNGAAEVNATLYTVGPKTSELKLLTLFLSERPNFLSNPLLEVVSDSGEKFPTIEQIPTTKPGDTKFDLLQVYFYSSSAISWMAEKFSYQPQTLKVRTEVGFPEKTNAAFYYQQEIRLGSGDNKIYSKLAQDRSVVTHEVMHSFVDTTARLPFKGEGGSLNEALCDALTALYLDNPKMGENAYLKGPFQRSIKNELTLQMKTGKLYADSLILSGTIWKIREATDIAHALDLSAYLLTYLVPSSDFADSQQVIKRWVSELKSSHQKSQIENVLKEHGWI